MTYGIHKMNTTEIVKKLLEQGIDYENLVPVWVKEGTTFYRNKINKTSRNRKTLELVQVTRNKIAIEDRFSNEDEFMRQICNE